MAGRNSPESGRLAAFLRKRKAYLRTESQAAQTQVGSIPHPRPAAEAAGTVHNLLGEPSALRYPGEVDALRKMLAEAAEPSVKAWAKLRLTALGESLPEEAAGSALAETLQTKIAGIRAELGLPSDTPSADRSVGTTVHTGAVRAPGASEDLVRKVDRINEENGFGPTQTDRESAESKPADGAVRVDGSASGEVRRVVAAINTDLSAGEEGDAIVDDTARELPTLRTGITRVSLSGGVSGASARWVDHGTRPGHTKVTVRVRSGETPVEAFQWDPSMPMMKGIEGFTGSAFFEEVDRRGKLFWEAQNAKLAAGRMEPGSAAMQTPIDTAQGDQEVVVVPADPTSENAEPSDERRPRRGRGRVATAATLAAATLISAGAIAFGKLYDRTVGSLSRITGSSQNSGEGNPHQGGRGNTGGGTENGGSGQENPPQPVERVSLNAPILVDPGEGWWSISEEELIGVEEKLGVEHDPNKVSIITLLNMIHSGRNTLEVGAQEKSLSPFAISVVVETMLDPQVNPELAALISQVLTGNGEDAKVEDVANDSAKRALLTQILSRLQSYVATYNEAQYAGSQAEYIAQATTLHDKAKASHLVFPDEV